jgi:hypothetical protein
MNEHEQIEERLKIAMAKGQISVEEFKELKKHIDDKAGWID